MEVRLGRCAERVDDVARGFRLPDAESDVRHGRREREADIAEPDDANVTIRILVGYSHETTGSEAASSKTQFFISGFVFRGRAPWRENRAFPRYRRSGEP